MSTASRVWQEVLQRLAGAPPQRKVREEIPGLLLILISFLAGIAATWERWGNPVVDAGRELNVPLRLVHGEKLYGDIHYLYGPFSVYVNAALYRLWEPSLWLMWGRVIVSAAVLLALVYWLARQIGGKFSAALACLAVTWVCALKSQGNYMLPYAYGGLDGSIFVLATTALLIVFLRKNGLGWIFGAGIAAALAALCKTEMGIAAMGTGLAAAAMGGFPRARGIAARSAVFLAPAVGIPTAVYACFAAQSGWHTLTQESHLFFGHVPWQLIYFNQLRFGFGRPWNSLWLMSASLARLVAFGGLLAGMALPWKRRTAALLLSSIAVIAALSPWLSDLGPFMAMPLILLALIAAGLAAFARESREGFAAGRSQAGVVTLLAVASLGSLMRIIFRVSTGGALSSFLLPGSVVLFVYVWLELFPLFLEGPAERRLARRLAAGVLAAAVLITAVSLSARYRRQFRYALVTERGTWRTTPEIGMAFEEAIKFIEKNTAPGDALGVMPEGTALNFFTGRRNPFREEIVTPGFLDAAGEERDIERLGRLRVPLVLIANRATREFGQTAFGVDYDQRLMGWIERNYRVCGVFGVKHDPGLVIGDATFFLRAYCRNP